MSTRQALHQQLLDLDQRSYKVYKQIQGSYAFPEFTLLIDYVQGDPFAAPSWLRVQVPQTVAQFPPHLYQSRSRSIALRDYLMRQFAQTAAAVREKRGSGNSGLIAIAQPGQAVLDRSTVFVTDAQIEARFVVGLPARGRQILGREAAALLCEDLPQIVDRSLKFAALCTTTPSGNCEAIEIQHHVETVEDGDWLRQQLAPRKLVAFIPDGAILPRQSGVNDQPLVREALPFQAPDSLRVQFDRPNQGLITGLGIPAGVTLIVGGGYHGKSTLLWAIARGIYNHIPGDGREQVVTDAAAVKVRAEDGRSIEGVNISPFINHLPQGRSTVHFSTQNASGSTSQAASIVEALEVGAKLLLVDEDTSATNFMIRDRRMQALVAKAQEPITPFIDKVRQLDCLGVSTILVMGGSGDYFDVADTVIAMTDFQPQDVTEQAKAIARQFATDRATEGGEQFGQLTPRIPYAKPFDARDDFRRLKLKVREVDELILGSEAVDVSAIEQIVEVGQLRAIGAAIAYLQQQYLDGRRSILELMERVEADVAAGGLDRLTAYPQGDLAEFRRFELAAVINRLRSLSVL